MHENADPLLHGGRHSIARERMTWGTLWGPAVEPHVVVGSSSSSQTFKSRHRKICPDVSSGLLIMLHSCAWKRACGDCARCAAVNTLARNSSRLLDLVWRCLSRLKRTLCASRIVLASWLCEHQTSPPSPFLRGHRHWISGATGLPT